MTLRAILSLSPELIWSKLRRWMLKRQIKSIDFHIAHIRSERDNGHAVERVLICRRINLQSELQDI